eukprot:6173287-Pleurochrysis_carterae.AAC.4
MALLLNTYGMSGKGVLIITKRVSAWRTNLGLTEREQFLEEDNINYAELTTRLYQHTTEYSYQHRIPLFCKADTSSLRRPCCARSRSIIMSKHHKSSKHLSCEHGRVDGSREFKKAR